MSEAYEALICVTTCRRVGALKRYLPHLARWCVTDPRFRLVVALDGDDPDTRAFCDRWEIPLVWSERREGVGLSRNRVLERWGDLPYYFFLDDDAELVDGSVFPAHVALFHASGIHHFSLFERGDVRGRTGESTVGGVRILHGSYGGGQFGFYTGEGLRAVGGWHPAFAAYRRWGHTEHSHRFVRAGLAPAPFNVAVSLADHLVWHYPPTVTRVEGVAVDADQIAAPERALMQEELEHVPLETIAPHHTNGVPPGPPRKLAAVLDAGARYPLVAGPAWRFTLSDWLLWRSRTADGALRRLGAFLGGAAIAPGNPTLRRRVRQVLGGARREHAR